MQEVQIDELSEALKTIVCEFGDQIQPFAMELTSNLLAGFWETIRNTEHCEFSDDIQEQSFQDQLESSINTINHILWCSLPQNFYTNSIGWFTDVFSYLILNPKTTVLLDNALELLNAFLY